jgi:hypothetical protein
MPRAYKNHNTMSPLPDAGAASSRSHRSMVEWFDRLVSSGALRIVGASVGAELTTTPLHALKVARKLHRVFLTYMILGSLAKGPTRGWGPVQCPRGEGNGHDTPEHFRF